MQPGTATEHDENAGTREESRDRTGALRAMLVRQHELIEEADLARRRLLAEITERRIAEDTLRASETFSRTILENSPDCVKLLDCDGHLEFMNAHGLCLLEVDDFAQVEHRLWWDLWGEESRPLVKDSVAKARQGETVQFQAFCATAKGTAKWWDVIVTPVPDDSGTPARLLSVSRDITESKRAEEALRTSEERYRGIVNQTIAGIAETDLTGRFLTVNDHYCEITGYTREELLGVRMQDITHEEDLPANLEKFQRLAETGASFDFEKRYVRKDGSLVWVHNYVSAIRDGAGEVQTIAAIVSDITARKLADFNTRFVVDLDKQLGALSVPEEIERTTINLLGQYLRASHCYFARIYDNDRGVIAREYRAPDVSVSLIAEHLVTAYTPPDRIEQFQRRETVVNHDVVADAGTAALADNFALVQIRAFASMPIHFGGEWVGVLNVTSHTPRVWRDDEVELLREVASRVWPLLERARAVAELCESKARFDIVKEGAQVGFWFCDLPFDTLIWDNRVKEHFWLPLDAEVTIDTFYQQLHPADRERTRQSIAESIANRTRYDIEYRTLSSDGQEKWIRAIGRTFYDAQAKPIRFDGVTLDVTERRRAEEALKENDRRKDEFLAMLAHELRNPLAPIRNAAQVLKLTGPADANQQWAREVIERQTQHLTRIVDDLLDVSRITQRKVTLQREPLEITTIIGSAVEANRPIIDARRQQLTVTLPSDSVRVEGDLTRLVQVVSNLMNNAAKYTDEGGHVSIAAGVEGGEVVVRVGDDGVGISPDLLPHVFDLFTQADRSLDRAQGGLGIGLTLVRLLVEMHGGRVEARSEGPGRGSEFIVRLAIAPVQVSTTGGRRAEVATPRAEGRPPLRVLVIEDNVDAAEMLGFMLTLGGHETRLAYDGSTVLTTVRAFQPQVILCDIGLPGMSGYDVAQQLRADPQCKHVRLIALSGYGQDEDRRRAKEAGFDYHLVKPVEPNALAALLDSLRADGHFPRQAP